MSPEAIQNPLAGVLIGSRVDGETGKISLPVVDAQISKFIDLPNSKFRLTGNSSYLSSTDMNQGSLSVSGSYGVSGIAKVSGSLTVVASEVTAGSNKTVALGMHYIKWAGAQYISFEDLDAAKLIGALDNAARASLLQALDKFQSLHTMVKGMDATKFQAVIDDTKNPVSEPYRTALADWANASAGFRRQFGSGVVAAVVWGGWGSVEAVITTATTQSAFSIAGSAQVEVAADGDDTKISASYGHKQATIGANATATVVAYQNGSCVENMVDQTQLTLSNASIQGVSNLGDQPVQDSTAMQAVIQTPNIPGFQAPPPATGPAVAALPQLYSDLAKTNQLGMLSSGAAWQGDGGTPGTFTDFVHAASANSQASATFNVDPTQPVIPPEHAAVAAAGHLGFHVADVSPAAESPDQPAGAMDAAGGPRFPGQLYEPLGIWVADWANLFPWLCSGRQNSIPVDAAPQYAWRLKIMEQDMLSLATLYTGYAASGLTTPWDDSTINYGQIGEDFSTAAATVSEFLASAPAGGAGAAEAKAALEQSLSGLGAHASGIYDTWDKNGFLRNANLGLGILQQSGGGYNMLTTFFPDPTYSFPRLNWASSEFKETNPPNYDVFAAGGKASPFILPNGSIYLFMMGRAADPSDTDDYSGLLGNVMDPYNHVANWLGITKIVDEAMTFDVVPGTATAPTKLFSNYLGADIPVIAYPLPFSAIGADTWFGTTISTGTGDLEDKLKALIGTLDAAQAWTLDSDLWPEGSLTSSYSMANIALHYLGVVDEPENIIPAIGAAARAGKGAGAPPTSS